MTGDTSDVALSGIGAEDTHHDARRVRRYSLVNQAFHWATAALMAAILPLGWVMVAGGGTPTLLPLWEWHKTLGLVVLLLTIVRLGWRWHDGAPVSPTDQPRWDRLVAGATYVLLFAILLLMPVSGYMMSTASGHPPILFDVVPTPMLIGKYAQVAALGKILHLTAQWFVYALILLHLAGVVWHVAVRRDRIVERMIPEPVDTTG